MVKRLNTRRRFLGVFLALAVAAPTLGLTAEIDSVRLNVGDPQAAVEWYSKNLGGRASKVDSLAAVAFGRTTISFAKAEGTIADSRGSGIDHLGFSFKDLDVTLRQLAGAGVKIVSGIEKDGPIRYAFVHDPWGTLIEVVEDPEILGFHHLHLAATDPKSTLKCYTAAFGGKVERFAGLIAGIRYGDAWVLVKKVQRPPAPTKGRAIDFVRWSVSELDSAVDKLRTAGAQFESGAKAAGLNGNVFFVGPDRVRIELVARRAQ